MFTRTPRIISANEQQWLSIFYLLAPTKICYLSLEAIDKAEEIPFGPDYLISKCLFSVVLHFLWLDGTTSSFHICITELLKINSPL